jgi:hypothetical protein
LEKLLARSRRLRTHCGQVKEEIERVQRLIDERGGRKPAETPDDPGELAEISVEMPPREEPAG